MLLTILLAGLCSMVFAQTIIMDNTDDLGNTIDQYGSLWDDDIALIFTTNNVPYDLYSVSLALYFYMNITSDVTFSIKLANSSNEPTGSVLASETFYNQSFSDTYAYKTYNFSSLDDYTFNANTKYALVVSTSKNIWMLPTEYSVLPTSSYYTVQRTAMYQSGVWYNFNYFAIRVKGTANAAAPTLTTNSITTYNATSATMGGNISSNGGASIEERGVVYSSTDTEPEIGDTGVTKDTNTSGLDNFSESISGLSPGTTYYVQAYATNSAGTSYGGVEEFSTLTPGLWAGATSSDWNTGSNWDDGTVPTSTIDVTIPADCSNYPVIDGDIACKNFTIENGGSVQINSNFSLNISGDLTLDNSSSFTNNGTLQFNGSDCHLSDNRTTRSSLGNIFIQD